MLIPSHSPEGAIIPDEYGVKRASRNESRGNESFSTGVSFSVDYLLNPGVSVGDGTLLLGLIFSLGI